MKRIAVFTLFVAALFVAGSTAASNAQDSVQFRSNWCESPVIVPLALADSTSIRPAAGVATARGASATLSRNGPVLRMNEVGSRVQVTLGQTLFHTQWIFAGVDGDDAVRVDALLGADRLPLTTTSVRGALRVAGEQASRGLSTVARGAASNTGQIDVLVAATEVLFTNEGQSSVDLVAAIGCPALELTARATSAPTWDPETQRFTAEYELQVRNLLANARTAALRSQFGETVSTSVDDFTLDLDLRADGFRTAELSDLRVSNEGARRVSDDFDGVTSTSMFAIPLRLTTGEPMTVRFAVSYEPDFNDPAWSESVGSPAPKVSLRGVVGDVQVGLSAVLQRTGAVLDAASTSPDRLRSPEPALVVEHTYLRPPQSRPDGSVALSERIVVRNTGDTALSDLTISYPQTAMYGVGSEVTAFGSAAAHACTNSLSPRFDGGRNAVMVFQEQGLAVGEHCTINLRTTLLPGDVPQPEATFYEAAVVATARSGRRDVQDAAGVEASITQTPRLVVNLTEPAVTNLEDGRHRIDGELTIRNLGDQDIDEIATWLTIATVEGDESRDARVFIEAIAGSEDCVARAVPTRSTSTVALGRGAALATAQSCSFDYSLITRTGAVVEGWMIGGHASGETPRKRAVDSRPSNRTFALPESPASRITVTESEIVNERNGNYSLVHEIVVTNTGDTPLVSVDVNDASAETFGEALRRSRKIADSCRSVSARSPLAAGGSPGSCTVTYTSRVEPGEQLSGWTIGASSTSVSTSGAVVEANASTEEITFTEAPAITAAIEIEEIAKIDDQSFLFVVNGSVENAGDIEARSVQAELDLAAVFGDHLFTIWSVRAFNARVDGDFDGTTSTQIFTGNGILDADETATWRIVVGVQSSSDPGPFTFTTAARAVSPAGETLVPDAKSVASSVPVVQVVDRVLEHTNNNDGTYDVEHSVSIRNIGAAALPSVSVTTDLGYLFRHIIVDETAVTSTCTDPLPAGRVCSYVERATLRPGTAVGPYEVSASVASVDDDGVDALVRPEPISIYFESRAINPLLFEEEPSIAVEAQADDVVNNGDGTYSIDYRFTVRNSGDVPLYRVGGIDPVNSTFEGHVWANELLADTCAEVSFGAPLVPGQSCVRDQTATIRPLRDLGPWELTHTVTADSPTYATVTQTATLEPLTFDEDVSVSADATIDEMQNVGDGSYLVSHRLNVMNTSDVPLVNVEASDAGVSLGDRRLDQYVAADTCSGVSTRVPLLPAEVCTIETTFVMQPGAELGPFSTMSDVDVSSPSEATAQAVATSNALTLVERPAIGLDSAIVSVEVVEDDRFRVVADLEVNNVGDIRLDDFQLNLNLAEVFPGLNHRIDGLISSDFEIAEGFAAEGTLDMLEPGQSLRVGEGATLTLIVSVEPGTEAGPFAGDFHASATSPAGRTVEATIAAKIDLPSIAIEVAAQSTENNRDGSYTVITSYALTNDGTTPLEFIRLKEDLEQIYQGASTSRVAIVSDEIAVASVDERRDDEVLEWGATLRIGQRAVVTTTVLVTPGNVLGPFATEVDIVATSPTGTIIGASIDTPPTLEFVERPALRVEQQLLRRPVWRSNGSFDVTFAIAVVNDGDVELRGVQVRQDLLDALGPNARIVVREIRSDTLAVNDDFDGLGHLRATTNVDTPGDAPVDPDADTADTIEDVGDTRLLQGWDVVSAGQTSTVELDLTITPETRGVYSTRVIVSAITPAGAGIGSVGEEIEANTLTRLSVQGELGVAKRVLGEPSVRPDGSVAVTYEILVENVGPFPLTNVELHDQLGQAFGTGSTFVTSRVRIEANSPCDGFASSSYDGGAIDPVLVSGVELAPSERCRVQYDAVVLPSKALPGPFRSSAFAIASDPFSGTVIDDSTDGTNTDPDGNQEPGDNDIATSVRVVVPEPAVSVQAESSDVVISETPGWFDFSYHISVTNPGALDLDDTQILLDLDDAWSVPFEVIAVESDDLTVNPDYDGEDVLNLISRRNRIRAGETVELMLRVSAARPRAGELVIELNIDATSVTEVSVQASAAAPVIVLVPDAGFDDSGQMFASLTAEEKRLLTLGGLAFLLFFVIFVHRVVRRFKAFRERRARRRSGDLVIDLRSGRTIDLRQGTQGTSHRRPSDRAGDDRHHHEPRRRRGRGHRVDR